MSRDDLLQAAARARTTKANENKQMDADLAKAFVDQIVELLPLPYAKG